MAKTIRVETVPLKEKMLLSIHEAATYSGIGINRIDAMLKKPDCPFVMYSGSHKLVKRELFENFINNTRAV